MSQSPKHQRVFASLQHTEKEDERLERERQARAAWVYQEDLKCADDDYYPYGAPDPKKVEAMLDSIFGKGNRVLLTTAQILEQCRTQTKARKEQKAHLAEIEAKALESQARVEQEFAAAQALSDAELFESLDTLNSLGVLLEVENQQLQTLEHQVMVAQTQNFEHGAIESDQHQNPSAGLTPELHAQLEQAVGGKLPNLELHTDATADLKAKSIGAIAFTTGNAIYFQAGKFDPFSLEGFQLLVHEATHVAQQAKGIVAPGIDTNLELEQAAKDKASQTSSVPKRDYSSAELNAFTSELKGLYGQHSSNPERFTIVADHWQTMPSEVQTKIQSRFTFGMNPRSSEAQRFEETFQARGNVKAVEVKTVTPSSSAPPVMLAPSNSFSTSVQRQTEMGFSSFDTQSMTVQRDKTPSATPENKTSEAYVQEFKKRLKAEAFARLEQNSKRLDAQQDQLKDTKADNPEWKHLRELAAKDAQLLNAWESLAKSATAFLKPNAMLDVTALTNPKSDHRIGKLEQEWTRSLYNQWSRNPNNTTGAGSKAGTAAMLKRFQTFIAPFHSWMKSIQEIEMAREQVRGAFPALAVLTRNGTSAELAKTPNTPNENQKLQTRVRTEFSSIKNDVKNLKAAMNKDQITPRELDLLVPDVLASMQISQTKRKQGDAKSKAVLDYLEIEARKSAATDIAFGVGAAVFLGLGGALGVPLAIGAGLISGGAGSIKIVADANRQSIVSNAQREGQNPLSSVDVNQANFNKVLSYIDVVLNVVLPIVLEANAFRAAAKAGQASVKAGELVSPRATTPTMNANSRNAGVVNAGVTTTVRRASKALEKAYGDVVIAARALRVYKNEPMAMKAYDVNKGFANWDEVKKFIGTPASETNLPKGYLFDGYTDATKSSLQAYLPVADKTKVPKLVSDFRKEWKVSTAVKTDYRLANEGVYSQTVGARLIQGERNVHHIIVDNIWRRHEFLQEMLRRGIGHPDQTANLIELASGKNEVDALKALANARIANPSAVLSDMPHIGKHMEYDKLVIKILDEQIENTEIRLGKDWTKFNDPEMIKLIRKIEDNLREIFTNNPSLLPKKKNKSLGKVNSQENIGLA